jgi:hypothetical protein
MAGINTAAKLLDLRKLPERQFLIKNHVFWRKTPPLANGKPVRGVGALFAPTSLVNIQLDKKWLT